MRSPAHQSAIRREVAQWRSWLVFAVVLVVVLVGVMAADFRAVPTAQALVLRTEPVPVSALRASILTATGDTK